MLHDFASELALLRPENPRQFLYAKLQRELAAEEKAKEDNEERAPALDGRTDCLRVHTECRAGGRVRRGYFVQRAPLLSDPRLEPGGIAHAASTRFVSWGTEALAAVKSVVHETAGLQAAGPESSGSGRGLTEDEAQLRRRIAADPQAFFAQADTNQDGSLTREEWAQACESVLGHAAPDLAKALFDQMDLDKDGTVSREEFVEMRNAIRLFVSGANTQGLLVEMLVGAVTAHLATTTPPHDTSVADKTLDALVSLKDTELHEAVAALSRAMREHGEQMRREREKRAKALTQLQLDEGEGKFANLPTAAYGTKDDFHKGLEVRRNGRDT